MTAFKDNAELDSYAFNMIHRAMCLRRTCLAILSVILALLVLAYCLGWLPF